MLMRPYIWKNIILIYHWEEEHPGSNPFFTKYSVLYSCETWWVEIFTNNGPWAEHNSRYFSKLETQFELHGLTAKPAMRSPWRYPTPRHYLSSCASRNLPLGSCSCLVGDEIATTASFIPPGASLASYLPAHRSTPWVSRHTLLIHIRRTPRPVFAPWLRCVPEWWNL